MCDKFSKEKCKGLHLGTEEERKKAREDRHENAMNSGARVVYEQMKADIASVETGKVKLADRFMNEEDMKFSRKIIKMTDECVKQGLGNLTVSLSINY